MTHDLRPRRDKRERERDIYIYTLKMERIKKKLSRFSKHILLSIAVYVFAIFLPCRSLPLDSFFLFLLANFVCYSMRLLSDCSVGGIWSISPDDSVIAPHCLFPSVFIPSSHRGPDAT